MRQAMQPWAVFGGLLGTTMVLCQSISGCAYDELAYSSGSGGCEASGGATGATIATSTNSGSGGDGGEGEGGSGGSVNHANDPINEEPSLDIQPVGQLKTESDDATLIIKGHLSDSMDTDTFSFELNENSVVRFETLDQADLSNCQKNGTSLQLTRYEGKSPVKVYTSLSKYEKSDTGIGLCTNLVYYLPKAATYHVAIRPSVNNNNTISLSDKGYVLKILAYPVKTEFDIKAHKEDATAVPLTLTNFENEASVALSGVASCFAADYYSLEAMQAKGKDIRVELIEGALTDDYSCENQHFPFVLEVNTSTESIGGDENTGRGNCPMINGFNSLVDPKAGNLPNEKIFIKAALTDTYCTATPPATPPATPIPYVLLVTVR